MQELSDEEEWLNEKPDFISKEKWLNAKPFVMKCMQELSDEE